jgi:putative transposase
MNDKFQNKYRISSTRLQNWDYGSNGSYFITICTKNRKCFFGNIENQIMNLSEIGQFADKFWMEIPNHFPFVELGVFVVMPNYVHGILIINKNGFNGNVVETRQCLVSTDDSRIDQKTIGQHRYQNQGKNTISSIIGSYKSVVTKNSHLINADFQWQSRFNDHIIRNSESFEKFRIIL